MAIKCDDNAMYIASVVMTYWFISISMVYLNKVREFDELKSVFYR